MEQGLKPLLSECIFRIFGCLVTFQSHKISSINRLSAKNYFMQPITKYYGLIMSGPNLPLESSPGYSALDPVLPPVVPMGQIHCLVCKQRSINSCFPHVLLYRRIYIMKVVDCKPKAQFRPIFILN